MKLKHLLLITMGSCSVTAMASNDASLLAIPYDTNSAKLLVCNQTNSIGRWTVSTPEGMTKVSFSAPFVQEAGACNTVGLRGITSDKLVPIASVNVKFEQLDNSNSYGKVIITNLSGKKEIGSANITKTFTADGVDFKNVPLLIYSYKVGNNIVEQLQNGKSYQNLSAGVAPDYVICAGGEASTCNDSHRY